MLREVLFAKIHRAVVTACHPDYMGSITIDRDLLDATGICINERVLVADCENGRRFETYVFVGERGTRRIEVNGAAASITGIGHKVIIMSFCMVNENELKTHRPRVAVCRSDNSIERVLQYDAAVSRHDQESREE
ncbi:MAG: aspartate 1-decarboxylase [Phycisphaerales bacterium]